MAEWNYKNWFWIKQVSQAKTSYSVIVTHFMIKSILSGLSVTSTQKLLLDQDAFTLVPDLYFQIFSALTQIHRRYLKYNLFKRVHILLHKLNLVFHVGLVYVLKL